MSNQLMTPDTAPRDVAALASQGPFIHRRLGEALELAGFKCWNNEREKSAFVTASPMDRAQALLVQLQAYDAAKGRAPAPQTQAAPPPPAAAGAAPAGGAPAGGTTTRAPRTASGGAVAAGTGVGNVVELLNAIKELQGTLGGIQAALTNQGQAGSVAAELQAIKGMVAASLKIQEVELGLLCLFGEQVLGATMADFIGEAPTYGTGALQKLQELTGKG
jgi:hypothetical protein